MNFNERMYLKKASWQREISSIVLWICLNLADLIVIIVTMMVMNGRFVEGNPVAALIGENFAGLSLYKIAITLLAVILLSRVGKLYLLQWLNVVVAAVVGWNLALLIVA